MGKLYCERCRAEILEEIPQAIREIYTADTESLRDYKTADLIYFAFLEKTFPTEFQLADEEWFIEKYYKFYRILRDSGLGWVCQSNKALRWRAESVVDTLSVVRRSLK